MVVELFGRNYNLGKKLVNGELWKKYGSVIIFFSNMEIRAENNNKKIGVMDTARQNKVDKEMRKKNSLTKKSSAVKSC